MSAPRPPRLILVRHGLADGAAGRCVGHADLALSAPGAAAVRRLVRSWSGPPPARLVTSDLARAADTAALFADAWGMRAEPDARLREMHFGEWEGRGWDEIGAGDAARLHRWMSGWTEERAPGGEGFPDVAARVAAWVADLRASCGGGATVLAVAHAGSIRALLCHLLGWTPAQAFRARVDHAHATALALGAAPAPHEAELHYANADAFPGAPGGRHDHGEAR